MFGLTRIVRFSVNPEGAGVPDSPNGYAARPSMVGIGTHYELVIRCTGELEKTGSYMLDIKSIDVAARTEVVPHVERACRSAPLRSPASVIAEVMGPLNDALDGRLASLAWKLSPRYSVEIQMPDTAHAILRQKFDFAASHRLHVPTLSGDENLRLFGKCNWANGHGHNYQFEPAVRVPVNAPGSTFTLQDLERIADETIVQRYDHRHLNMDTAEFGPSGVNPSVENIAHVFYTLLEKAIAASGKNAALASVTVWETDRTSSTFPASGSTGTL